MTNIFCIIDGMTDEEFQIRDYPNLARMAGEGVTGWLATTPLGFCPGTLPCVLTLLGLEPEEIPQKGRAWLEAQGLGIPAEKEDLLLRATWTALDGEERLAGMTEGPAEDTLPRLPGLRYYEAGPGKGILVLPGQGRRLREVKAPPPHEKEGQILGELNYAGPAPLPEFLAACRRPGLALLPWGESAALKLPQLPLLQGAAAITATPIVKGLALQLGFKVLTPEGATGDVDSDLKKKTAAALQLAKDNSLVLYHIGGADEAAHRLLPAEKRRFLARVDEEVLGPLLAAKSRLLVTADHGTSPYTGRHLGEPQPFFLWGPDLMPESGTAAAKRGNLAGPSCLIPF